MAAAADASLKLYNNGSISLLAALRAALLPLMLKSDIARHGDHYSLSSFEKKTLLCCLFLSCFDAVSATNAHPSICGRNYCEFRLLLLPSLLL